MTSLTNISSSDMNVATAVEILLIWGSFLKIYIVVVSKQDKHILMQFCDVSVPCASKTWGYDVNTLLTWFGIAQSCFHGDLT